MKDAKMHLLHLIYELFKNICHAVKYDIYVRVSER